MGRLVDIEEVIKAVDKHTKDECVVVLDEDITVILEEVPTANDEEIRNKVINDVFNFLKNHRDKKYMKVNFDDLEIRKYKEQLKS